MIVGISCCHSQKALGLFVICVLEVYLMFFFCTVHCNITVQYKLTKCTFSELIFSFSIFCCLLHVSNPRVHLQEGGCIYRYGMVCFTCSSISGLVGKKVRSTYTTSYTDACKTYHTITVYTTFFLKKNLRV